MSTTEPQPAASKPERRPFQFSLRTLLLAVTAFSGLCGLTCWVSNMFVTRVPPRSSTHGTIWIMKQRILRYAKLHNSLPNSINDLPVIPDKIDRVQDACVCIGSGRR